MPETPLHQRIIGLLVMVLSAWITRSGRDAMAGSNIALRWDRSKPSTGVDPDVYLVEPAPPKGEAEKSLCLWKEGHHAPRVAIEVVSAETADKDYHDGPARYAASGVRELWVFDPLRLGPADGGGPWALQVWRRVKGRQFVRVHAGEASAFSRELGAWVVATDEGTRLRIADDAAGAKLWPTADEAERRAREAAEAVASEERRAREAAEQEVARLRAELKQARAKRAPRRS
ncbi:MAG: Uma2 family endonuclease [Deltaproteobacteria bacterium]|nr:Uma2 family endonuclease [Myxococcales bacterium]MDP3217958.1 Uma2 family endonuclease [Deltaproteobacteria bacterium]